MQCDLFKWARQIRDELGTIFNLANSEFRSRLQYFLAWFAVWVFQLARGHYLFLLKMAYICKVLQRVGCFHRIPNYKTRILDEVNFNYWDSFIWYLVLFFIYMALKFPKLFVSHVLEICLFTSVISYLYNFRTIYFIVIESNYFDVVSGFGVFVLASKISKMINV